MKRFGCTGVLGIFLIAAVVVSMIAGQKAGGTLGAKDASEKGHMALALLMKNLGFELTVFDRSPRELSKSDAEIVVLLSVPEMDAKEDAASFAPSWYAKFIERGGDLVVPIGEARDLEFLSEGLGLDFSEFDLTLSQRDTQWTVQVPSPSDALEFEQLSLRTNDQRLLELGMRPKRDVKLWLAEGGRHQTVAAVAILQRGAGRLVLFAASHSFENKMLVKADNGLLFVRLMESLQAGKAGPRQIFFDQASAMEDRGGSWVSALFQAPLWPITLATCLAACLWVWSLSSRQTFSLDRRLERRPAPALRADSLAGLVSRAGHPEWLDLDTTDLPSDAASHD